MTAPSEPLGEIVGYAVVGRDRDSMSWVVISHCVSQERAGEILAWNAETSPGTGNSQSHGRCRMTTPDKTWHGELDPLELANARVELLTQELDAVQQFEHHLAELLHVEISPELHADIINTAASLAARLSSVEAERDELRAAVKRVEKLAETMETSPSEIARCYGVDLRAALSGSTPGSET